MKKRWVIGLAILGLLVFGIAWLNPSVHYRFRGYAGGESFYRGWPTSFWISAFKEDPFIKDQLPSRDIGKLLSEGGVEAAPVLVEMVQDDDPEIRQQALAAIGTMGPGRKLVLPTLIRTLTKETDPHMFQWVGLMFAGLDKEEAVEIAATALRENTSPSVRAWAAATLVRLSRDCRSAFGPINEALRDPDIHVRTTIVQLIKFSGKLTPEASEVLVEALKNEAASVRLAAADWRGWNERTYPPLVRALHAALEDPDLPVRIQAAHTLWLTEGQVQPLVPVVLEALRSSQKVDMENVLQILRGTGPEGKEIMDAVHELLADGDANRRTRAAQALGALGPDAADIPKLIERLTDESPGVRKEAAAALREAGEREATIPLLALLNDPSLLVCQEAVMALGNIHPAGKDVVLALVNVLKENSEGDLGLSAIRALGNIGLEAKPAIPELVKVLKDPPDGRFPLAAIEALGQIKTGPGIEAAVPQLISELDNVRDNRTHRAAIHSMGQIKARPELTVPALIEALKVTDSGWESEIADSLGALGAEAHSAVPALVAMTKHRSFWARLHAAEALWQIERKPEQVLPVVFPIARNEVIPEPLQVVNDQEAIRTPVRNGNPAPASGERMPFERAQAIKIVCQVDPQKGIPMLLQAIQGKDPELRSAAIRAAGELGPAGKAVVPALIQMLHDKEAGDRAWSVSDTLQRIGPDARDALPALREAANRATTPYAKKAIGLHIKRIEQNRLPPRRSEAESKGL